jgi:PTS system ascorbate-specific IIA component
MSVGLLLLCHDHIGEALLDCATVALGGQRPLRAENLCAGRDCNPEGILEHALAAVGRLDEGDGVLVLTDLFGSTPSNIAARLLRDRGAGRVRVVSGINLPMLIRILNYPQLPLEELARKAVSGARAGIVDCQDIVDSQDQE